MLTDDKNNKWVWDPWVGFNKNLLPLQQWMYRANEPKPIKLVVTNSMVIYDFDKGKCAEGINLMATTSENYRRSIQAMFSKALPNRPQFAISNLAHEFQLFKKKKDSSKKPVLSQCTSVSRSDSMRSLLVLEKSEPRASASV